MSDSIQWGVLGCATIARVCVIPAIQASHNGTVAAIASRSPSKAKELSHLHDIPKVYAEYAALLDDPDIDAVYIPLPNHLHCRWTIKALDAGKHVLCEKPLARNAAEAGKMAVAAARTGKQLMEGFMYRFHSRSRRIKQMIDTNAIGTPLLVRSAFCYRMKQSDWDSPKNARLNPDMGGGALLDVGCYSVSVARWMLGTEPVRVQAQAVFHPNDVDIHLVGSLRFPGNRLATLEASFISALQQTYTVIGSEGAIETPHNAFIPWDREAIFVLREKEQEQGRAITTSGEDQYRKMVEHFADAVLNLTQLAYPPGESVCNMRVLDALAQAARTSKAVDIQPGRPAEDGEW